MKKSIIPLLMAVMIAMPLWAQENKETREYIEVQGRAEEEIVPDEIYLRVTIDEKEMKKPLESVEKEMKKQLADLGINVGKDLEVLNMFSAMQKRFLKNDNVIATKSYVLKVASVVEMDKVFDLFDKLKIADVRLDRAQLSRNHPVFVALYTKAAANAKVNAEAIAKGLEIKIGRPIYAQSNYNNYPIIYAQPRAIRGKAMIADAEMANGVEETELNLKKIKVECMLQARFLIEK